ncbi:MAG: hypothetical protein PHU85_00130 [Phycisphaerae bacterium]|nr:hypothetical protein [Phycisphaerae bacterium]
MKFNIVAANHPAFGYVEDLTIIARLVIEAAGCRCVLDGNASAGCQVFIEGGEIRPIRRAIESRGDFVLLATECITGATLNGFGAGVPGHYGNAAYWQKRFNALKACAPFARAIWSTFEDPQQLDLYRGLAGGIPVLPLPFAHFGAYERVQHAEAKGVDILFWGSKTPHRKAVLTALSQRHRVEWPEFLSDAQRRKLTARAKVCVSVRQCPGWGVPSIARYWFHVANGSCLVGERCKAGCALDPYVLTVDDLPTTCDHLLAGERWQRQAAEAYERFAAERPGRPAAEAFLERSFART